MQMLIYNAVKFESFHLKVWEIVSRWQSVIVLLVQTLMMVRKNEVKNQLKCKQKIRRICQELTVEIKFY